MTLPAWPTSNPSANLFTGAMIAVLLLVVCLFVLPPIYPARNTPPKTRTLNNLRNVALAVQSYATVTNGNMPAGGSPDESLPLWSWQTTLLPYLEQNALYRRIDFDRPWNAPGNAELFAADLAILLSPRERNREPVDGFAITHFAGNSRVMRPREWMTIQEVSQKDGGHCTILMGEIGTGFPPWGRPGNTRDPARGLKGGPDQFGNSEHGSCAIMFVGGNGKFLNPEIARHVLELLADPDNGAPNEDEY